MNKKLTAFLFAIFCTYSIFAQMPVVVNWVDKVLDTILVEKNIRYGSAFDFAGDSVPLELNIYRTVCTKGSQILSNQPLLVVIHGGSFLAGNKDEPSIVQYCKDFAARGYIAVSINYRLGFVNDNGANNCNYPNYQCFFAADSAEWFRALYRGIQDANDAINFMLKYDFPIILGASGLYQVNAGIDQDNIFVVGESAGALIALGVALMDSTAEKFPQAYALNSLPKPHSNTSFCPHNSNRILPDTIARPDLGSIFGSQYNALNRKPIKAVGNMFGALTTDLLKLHKTNQKPAIFSYHRPCDLVVPIDEGTVYNGLNWCFTNGYGCFAIDNVPKVYGSRSFSKWNDSFNYGYTISNYFTTDTFNFAYLLGQYSCVNQVNQSCHGYDNRNLRDSLLAAFFAPFVSSQTRFCLELVSVDNTDMASNLLHVYPNPFSETISIHNNTGKNCSYYLYDMIGRQVMAGIVEIGLQQFQVSPSFAKGNYVMKVITEQGVLTQRLHH